MQMYTIFDRTVWESRNTTLFWRSRCKYTPQQDSCLICTSVLQFTHFLLEKGFCLIPKEQNKWSEGSDSYLSNLLTPWGLEASALFPHTKNTTCEHRSDSLLPCGMGCLWMRFRWNCWNSLPVVESYASIKLPPSGRKLPQHETVLVVKSYPSIKLPPSSSKLSQHEVPSQH